MPTDLQPVFVALREILRPYARSFKVTDRKGFYSLDDKSVRGWSIDFGAVVMKPRAVSFYLLPTVWNPELLDGASPALLAVRTKAGKFFNFKTVDPKLFRELAGVVAKANRIWDPAAIAAR